MGKQKHDTIREKKVVFFYDDLFVKKKKNGHLSNPRPSLFNGVVSFL